MQKYIICCKRRVRPGGVIFPTKRGCVCTPYPQCVYVCCAHVTVVSLQLLLLMLRVLPNDERQPLILWRNALLIFPPSPVAPKRTNERASVAAAVGEWTETSSCFSLSIPHTRQYPSGAFIRCFYGPPRHLNAPADFYDRHQTESRRTCLSAEIVTVLGDLVLQWKDMLMMRHVDLMTGHVDF